MCCWSFCFSELSEGSRARKEEISDVLVISPPSSGTVISGGV